MTDIVTISGPVDYKAWMVPRFAHVMIGDTEAKLPVEGLTNDALDALAQQWLDHLFASVARPSPFVLAAKEGKGK